MGLAQLWIFWEFTSREDIICSFLVSRCIIKHEQSGCSAICSRFEYINSINYLFQQICTTEVFVIGFSSFLFKLCFTEYHTKIWFAQFKDLITHSFLFSTTFSCNLLHSDIRKSETMKDCPFLFSLILPLPFYGPRHFFNGLKWKMSICYRSLWSTEYVDLVGQRILLGGFPCLLCKRWPSLLIFCLLLTKLFTTSVRL